MAARKTLDPQPRRAVRAKKKQRDRLIGLAGAHGEDWTLGFLDEVWWSRLAKPSMHAWAGTKPLRLLESTPDQDPDPTAPKALGCYGVYVPGQRCERPSMLVRFVQERPTSNGTCGFLQWVCERLEARGKRVWVLIWDNASWHTSYQVQRWIRTHNQQSKKAGEGVRILPCLLPTRSPWLNPIESKWLHGKRAIVKPGGVLTAEEVIERVHGYFGCERLAPIPKNTS